MGGEQNNNPNREGSSPNLLTPETRTVTEIWNRPSRQITNPVIIGAPEQQRPSNVTQLEPDTRREQKTQYQIQICVREMEGSQFYQMFMTQLQTPKFLNRLNNVLGAELKMQMIIYGIGSIENNENSKWQLSLAILMKRNLSWIGGTEVFDPILTAIESWVLQTLGFSVLSVNEEARKSAVKPMFFYMPYCEEVLYNNLLETNWGEQLKNIVLFGNTFELYHRHVTDFPRSSMVHEARHVLAARKFTEEFCIPTVPNASGIEEAFESLGWLFFSPDLETQLQLTQS